MSFKGMLLKAGIVPGAGFVRSVTLSGAATIGINLSGSYTTTAIQIGDGTTALTLAAADDHAIDIYTTCSIASNSDNPVTPFHLKSVTTGFKSEDRAMSVESYTTVYSGNENTVGHFYSNWVGTGIGPLGMASAVTAKMLLPTSCTGAFFPFYGKINFPATPYAGITGAGNSVGWFMLSIGGDSGGYSNFDDYGLFMEIHNITADTDNLLSLTGQTLRCAVPDAGTTRYLMLSQMQDGLGLGNSSTDMALGTSTTQRAIDIYTSSTATSGSVKPIYSRHTVKALGTSTHHRAEFCTRTDYGVGGSINALKGYLDFGSTGYNGGLGAAVNVELRMPNMLSSGGSYFPLSINMVLQGSSDFNGNYGGMAGFIHMNAVESGTNFDTKGRFMMICGLTAAAGSVLSADSQTLKVAFNPSGSTLTERYMVLSQMENGLKLGTDTTTMIDFGTVTAAKALAVYVDSGSVTNGSSVEYIYGYCEMTGALGCGGRATFHTKTTVGLGAWCSALKGYMEFGAGTAQLMGIGAAIVGEMKMPGREFTNGQYCCFEAEMVTPANSTGYANCETSFIYMNASDDGTALAEFNQRGYLFSLGPGISDTPDGLFDVITAAGFDGALRICIAGVPYFIPISLDTTFT